MDEQENNWGSGSWGSGPHHRHEGMHGPPSGGPEGKFMGPRHGFCGHGSSDFGPHHYGYIGMHDRPGGMYMHPRMGPWAQGPCRFRQQQFKFMNMQKAPWGGQYGMHPGMGSWGMRRENLDRVIMVMKVCTETMSWTEGMHKGSCHGPEGMHMHPKIGHGMGFPSGDHHQMHFMRHINWETFMPFELAETCEIYIITMPLPGFETKDIEVSVKEHRILIEAKRSEPEKSVSEPDVEAGAER